MVHFFAASTATLEKRVECGAAAQVHSQYGHSNPSNRSGKAFVDLLPSSKVGTIILRAFWLASPYSGTILWGCGGAGGGGACHKDESIWGYVNGTVPLFREMPIWFYVMHYGVGIRVFYRP